jgi:hypothetical protein
MQPGSALNYSGILLYIKGDWSEAVHTLGLGMWNNVYSPCQFCSMSRDEIKRRGHCLSCEAPDWPLRTHEDYDSACKKCEVHIKIESRDQMKQLLGVLRWSQSNQKRTGLGGRCVVEERIINGVSLFPGDRVEPSDWVPDIGQLDKLVLPRWVTLWRARLSHDGKVIDGVSHRCPLFSQKLFSSPASTLAVDALHTVALGVLVRYVSASLWRIVLENVWNVRGDLNTVVKNSVDFLKAELLLFQDDPSNGIERSRRIETLTVKMLGKRLKCNLQDHIFCPLSFWSVNFLCRRVSKDVARARESRDESE